MFTAKVYKICIASPSGAMKEERIAQDVVAKWNCQNGEGCGVVFMQVPLNDFPDVCVFVIDNYVDAKKVESVIATGANIALFFSMCHDPQNTMGSEIKAIEELRERVQASCVCVDYKNNAYFEKRIIEYLDSVVV